MKPGWSASRRVNLLYVSTSLLWWQAVVGRIGVQSRHALRSNARRTWRHREGARNGHHTALHRALSPLHPCGSVTVCICSHDTGHRWEANSPQPVLAGLMRLNWLRVLDTAERSQIDQGIRHQLHPIVPLLEAFKAE